MRHTPGRLIPIIVVLATATILPARARAQGNPVESAMTHIGVGAGIDFINPSNSDGKSSTGATIAYRWHSFHSGWGPTFGLDWHSTDFNQPVGSVDAPLGTLRMRALLAGFGHTRRLGRFSASASVSAGYSFNDFSVDSGAVPAFANAGVALLGATVDNCAVLKPSVAVWYDVAKHIGVGISAGYLVARPDRTLTTTTGSETRTLKADAFELSVGLTFGVWKKR
jgi:hypothetical protein